jgi:hypothetical protein
LNWQRLVGSDKANISTHKTFLPTSYDYLYEVITIMAHGFGPHVSYGPML